MSNTIVTTDSETQKQSRLKDILRSLLPYLTISLLSSLLVAVIIVFDVIVIIRPGEAGILWNRFGGTKVDLVYEEGIKLISPFDKMYVFEVRKQLVTHELAILSVDGLKVQLYLAIRFRPKKAFLGLLHDRIGTDYLTRVVIPQTESVLRKRLGAATAEQIYTNENGLLAQAMVKAIEEVGRNFVEIEDIIIRRIELPATVRQAIENKLVQQELLASYEFRNQTALQEAERKRIESEGIRDYNQIIASTLTDDLLRYQGISATLDIAESDNDKTVVIGTGDDRTPIILSTVPISSGSSIKKEKPEKSMEQSEAYQR